MKAVRELGSDRRETGRSLSAVGVGNLRSVSPSTRGLGRTALWCTGCPARGTAGEPGRDRITADGVYARTPLQDEGSSTFLGRRFLQDDAAGGLGGTGGR